MLRFLRICSLCVLPGAVCLLPGAVWLLLEIGGPAGVARAADDPSAMRTWSDATGRFKIKGEFVSLENEVVTLRQADGKELEIPLAKLSAADRELAKQAAEAVGENPFAPKSGPPGRDNPFAPSGGGMPAARRSGGSARSISVDWSAAREVNPQPESPNWSGAVTAEQLAAGAVTLKPKTVRLPAKRDFFEKDRDVVFSPGATQGVVGYTLEQRGERGAPGSFTTRIVLFDPQGSRVAAAAQTEGEFIPLGLDDAATRLFVRKTQFGFGNSDELEVWGMSAKGIARRLQWIPHDDMKGGERDIHWGTGVADDRGLSLGSKGKLVLWNLETGAPEWFLETGRNHTPAVSPNRKYLAYAGQSAVGVLEIATGKVLALLPDSGKNLSVLAFSPDGKYLAGAGGNTIFVWNSATGELYREITDKPVLGQHPLAWASPKTLLIGGHLLVDVESRITMWEYSGAEVVDVLGGLCWFYLTGSGPEALVAATIPHPAAEQALAQAASDPKFLVLRPGDPVAVDVSGVPEAVRAKMQAALQSKLTNAGFKLAATAPVVAKATVLAGKNYDVIYTQSGMLFFASEGTKYVSHDNTLTLSFWENGKATWQTSTTKSGAPRHLERRQDQTVAQALTEASTPTADMLNWIAVPKYVPRTGNRPALGSSSATLQGVQ